MLLLFCLILIIVLPFAFVLSFSTFIYVDRLEWHIIELVTNRIVVQDILARPAHKVMLEMSYVCVYDSWHIIYILFWFLKYINRLVKYPYNNKNIYWFMAGRRVLFENLIYFKGLQEIHDQLYKLGLYP